MKKVSILFIFISSIFQVANAQNFADKTFYLVDSLDLKTLVESDRTIIDNYLTIYHAAKDDTTKLLQLNALVEDCENEIWIKYNQLIIDFSLKKINTTERLKLKNVFKKFLASGYNNFGFLNYQNNEIEKAVSYFEKAITLSYEINDLTVVPVALNNLGFIFKQQGNVLKALDYYHEALKINKQIDDKKEMSLMYNNIGGIYFKQKEYEEALNYFRDALLVEKEYGSEKGVARIYSNIGSIYEIQNKHQAAMEYYSESYKIYTTIENKKGQATSLSKLILLELELLKKEKALSEKNLTQFLAKHKQALQLYIEVKDEEGMAYSMCNIATVYTTLADYTLAKEYGKKSLHLAKEIGFPENIKNAAQILKKIAEKEKNYQEAFLMQELYYQMQDSISNASTKEVTLEKQFQYEYDKKLIADSIQNSEKEKITHIELNLKDEQIKRQNTQRYALFGGIVILLVFGGFTYKRYKKSQKQKAIIAEQKKLVEHKSREITDSINYAKHIQDSLLPATTELTHQLKNSFVYYYPKDIVAGDFYWMEKIGDLILFAVADCTGHGVPGAMVSVVCNNALTRSIGEFQLKKPAEILNKTRELVIKTFNRRGDDFKLQDGMDIALCALKFIPNGAELQYAGANNPLWVVSKNEEKMYSLTEIKPDKQPISNYYKQTEFTNHSLTLKKGDAIYIFSDGYADQFGGEKGKKMMYKPFKNLLISIQDLDMNKQKEVINNHFQTWKGNLEQVDDVCIIGVRI